MKRLQAAWQRALTPGKREHLGELTQVTSLVLVIAAWNIWRLQDGIGAMFHLSAAVLTLLLLSLAGNLLDADKHEGWHHEDYSFQTGGFVALGVVLFLLSNIMIGIVTLAAWLYAPDTLMVALAYVPHYSGQLLFTGLLAGYVAMRFATHWLVDLAVGPNHGFGWVRAMQRSL
tara:strand:- start:3200 stop:3718 length:519 start_codon:yes stop_codon:yes gene_type:complete